MIKKNDKEELKRKVKSHHNQLILEELILMHDVYIDLNDPYPDDNSGVCFRKHRKSRQVKSSVYIPSQLLRERRLKEKRISRQRYFDMESKYNSM